MTVNNEMDFEFMLKKSFDEEAPELPESLKKENVIKMLEEEKNKPKKKKKHIFPKVLATAAAPGIQRFASALPQATPSA